MESCFRIFQLVDTKGQIHLCEACEADSEIFKYHEEKGNFKNHADASHWLRGLSTLKGQFVIMEVFTKK